MSLTEVLKAGWTLLTGYSSARCLGAAMVRVARRRRAANWVSDAGRSLTFISVRRIGGRSLKSD
jgi:hypothetical protein